MLRPALLVLAMLILLPAEVEAKRFSAQRWPVGEVIIVENRMGPEWNDAVAFTAAQWRRTFPRLRFRVIHRDGGCKGRERAIVLCEVSATRPYSGETISLLEGREVVGVQIKVVRHDQFPLWDESISMFDMATLCHEFGHALSLNHAPNPETSCVIDRSTRITPGPYDRNSLKLLYSRKGPAWP